MNINTLFLLGGTFEDTLTPREKEEYNKLVVAMMHEMGKQLEYEYNQARQTAQAITPKPVAKVKNNDALVSDVMARLTGNG